MVALKSSRYYFVLLLFVLYCYFDSYSISSPIQFVFWNFVCRNTLHIPGHIVIVFCLFNWMQKWRFALNLFLYCMYVFTKTTDFDARALARLRLQFIQQYHSIHTPSYTRDACLFVHVKSKQSKKFCWLVNWTRMILHSIHGTHTLCAHCAIRLVYTCKHTHT